MQGKQEMVDKVVAFHGHLCSGLAIGIRVAELALQEMQSPAEDEELVAVVENDNCSVDAIQSMTGCTFGKGNFIFQDYGKNVYRFYRRSDGKAIRISQKPDVGRRENSPYQVLLEKKQSGTLTPEEEQSLEGFRLARITYILSASLMELFDVQEIQDTPPEKARIYESLACAGCGERTMETRLRRINGAWYCLPCYYERERIL
jgi:formylmethanofuran dehydrogenase subunit E